MRKGEKAAGGEKENARMAERRGGFFGAFTEVKTGGTARRVAFAEGKTGQGVDIFPFSLYNGKKTSVRKGKK